MCDNCWIAVSKLWLKATKSTTWAFVYKIIINFMNIEGIPNDVIWVIIFVKWGQMESALLSQFFIFTLLLQLENKICYIMYTTLLSEI